MNGTASVTRQPVKEHEERGAVSREFRRAHTRPNRDMQLRDEQARTVRITDAERAMSEPANAGVYIAQVADDAGALDTAGVSAMRPSSPRRLTPSNSSLAN
jgi:hypothetical protein